MAEHAWKEVPADRQPELDELFGRMGLSTEHRPIVRISAKTDKRRQCICFYGHRHWYGMGGRRLVQDRARGKLIYAPRARARQIRASINDATASTTGHATVRSSVGARSRNELSILPISSSIRVLMFCRTTEGTNLAEATIYDHVSELPQKSNQQRCRAYTYGWLD